MTDERNQRVGAFEPPSPPGLPVPPELPPVPPKAPDHGLRLGLVSLLAVLVAFGLALAYALSQG